MDVKQLIADYLKKEGVDTLVSQAAGAERLNAERLHTLLRRCA